MGGGNRKDCLRLDCCGRGCNRQIAENSTSRDTVLAGTFVSWSGWYEHEPHASRGGTGCEQSRRIVETTCIAPKDAHTGALVHWPALGLAHERGAGREANGLQPHRSRPSSSHATSILEKLTDVVGLYLNRRQGSVFCVTRSHRSSSGSHPTGLPKRGRAEHDHDYVARHDDAFAALNVLEGTVIGECSIASQRSSSNSCAGRWSDPSGLTCTSSSTIRNP